VVAAPLGLQPWLLRYSGAIQPLRAFTPNPHAFVATQHRAGGR
jgi:hypothetical protein